MRILMVILVAALVGIAVGTTVAYVEVRGTGTVVAVAPADAPPDLPPSEAEDSPRVEVEKPHHNFGTMERGHEKSHKFLIRNVGTAPLQLKVGQTSCKCTLGEVTNDAIAPGESTHVTLEWSAKSDLGPFRQTATLITNDPLRREIELMIDGEIVNASGIEPAGFFFDKLAVGESRTAEVFVMAMLEDELSVESAELGHAELREKFDIKMEPVGKEQLPNKTARDGVRITLTAKPGLPVGRFDDFLTIKTNLNDGETLHIPVYGRVIGDISPHGPGWIEEDGVLVIGRVGREGKKSHLNLMVRGENAKDVKFEVASVDPPELKAAIGEPKQIHERLAHVPLDIEVPPNTRPMIRLATSQGDEAKVVLKTTHPKVPELVLGVRFSVER